MEVNKIYNTNCIDFMRGGVLNNKVDLVLTDPPYEFISNQTKFSGDLKNRKHLQDINTSFGMKFDPVELLELCKTVCKKFNGYFFTNKNLLTKYIGWAEQNKYKWDLLLWLKPNPVPISA